MNKDDDFENLGIFLPYFLLGSFSQVRCTVVCRRSAPPKSEPRNAAMLWDPFVLHEARQELQEFHVMVGRWGFSCLKWSLFRGHVKFSGGVSDVFFWNVRLSSCFFRGDGTLSAGIFVDFQALPLGGWNVYQKLPSWMKSENHWSVFHVYYWLPSRELTYPLKSPFWRWFSFSPGGI